MIYFSYTIIHSQYRCQICIVLYLLKLCRLRHYIISILCLKRYLTPSASDAQIFYAAAQDISPKGSNATFLSATITVSFLLLLSGANCLVTFEYKLWTRIAKYFLLHTRLNYWINCVRAPIATYYNINCTSHIYYSNNNYYIRHSVR